MDEQRRVPHRQKAHRRGRVGIGQWCAGDVDELLALFVAEPAELQALQGRLDRGHLETRPVGDVVRRSRAEATEVAANEVIDPLLLGHVLRPDPVLGEGVEVGAAAFPGSGGRNADEVEPEAGRP